MSTLTGDCARLRRNCRDRARAGARPAGQGFARAALECAQLQAVVDVGRDVDVDPLGKGGIVLDPRPEFLQRDFARVGHEEDEVRVADIDRHRLLEPVPRHRQRGRVHRIGEGDFVPAEARLAER